MCTGYRWYSTGVFANPVPKRSISLHKKIVFLFQWLSDADRKMSIFATGDLLFNQMIKKFPLGISHYDFFTISVSFDGVVRSALIGDFLSLSN